jgi:hypothetical protein
VANNGRAVADHDSIDRHGEVSTSISPSVWHQDLDRIVISGVGDDRVGAEFDSGLSSASQPRVVRSLSRALGDQRRGNGLADTAAAHP